MAVEVILNVFSQRPNPRWLLDAAQAGELERRLAALETTLPEQEREPRLGYRGFLIEGMPGSLAAEPIRVFGGVVELRGGARLDRGRALERWLLDSAGEALAPDLRALLPRD